MSSVQLENGYTKIANEILEEMAKVKLSPTQYRLLFVIWRFTYGFNRKEHKISLTFLSQATGCDLRQIQRELKRLEERKLIVQKVKSGSTRGISFNKNHNEWVFKITNGETDNRTIGENVKETFGEIGNQERNKKTYKQKRDQLKKSAPYLEYEKLFGTPPAMLVQRFIYWIEKSKFQDPEEIICETVKRAKLKKTDKPGAYVESILKKLHSLKLYTLSAVQEHNSKFDTKFESKKSGSVPSLNNMFDKPTKKALTEEELEEIKLMEEELPF